MSPSAPVWLVEDSALETERVRGVLRGHFEVKHFTNAETMLECLAEVDTPPHLLVLDWQLPGMSGLEACRFLREQRDAAALPILLLTVRSGREDFREGLDAGANDFVSKPYDAAELLARVRNLTRVGRAVAEVRAAQEALRASEARLRLVVDNLPFLINFVDARERYVFTNEAYRTWFGVEPSSLVGRPMREGIGEVNYGRFRPFIERALGGEAVSFEVPYRFRDGREAVLHVTYVPHHAADGALQGFVSLVQDITERKTAEWARQDEESARAAFEQKLVGIVGHDLRQPLQAISMSATLLLRREDLDERSLKAASRIQGAAERGGRMLRDLLDFTQARVAGSIQLQRVEADLAELVHTAADEARTTYPERQVEVRVQGRGEGCFDPDRLHQVLDNLLANALAYGSLERPVRLELDGRGEGEVVLRVHNWGAPIPAALLPVLFAPMTRGSLHGVQRRSIGLGLFIVRHVVEGHEGRIEVASSEAEGTTFTVRLPRRPRG